MRQDPSPVGGCLMLKKSILYTLNHPKSVIAVSVVLMVMALAQFPKIKVDTDPENMLPADAPVRVFHHETKKEFALYDFVVVGIVNEKDPNGVFNPKTLTTVYRLTEDIKQLDGVITQEIISLSTKDNIEQAELGSVRFQWLMETPPDSPAEALRIREEAQDHPMFRGSLVSDDGKALAIYIPIERKDLSYDVALEVQELIKKYPGDEDFHITGLPVAEDQFGVEMFKQMAISAPLAGLIIFLLMLFFFRSVKLVAAPMIVAVLTVIITMGLLIGFGYPVHIMSSMIPIFLMPIAVLDSV
ncbi:MAG: MMPL family transporter, partial [Candidatus Omnitrophica bacterium]|nr:MMPL family transporter [Candidatus Omnitrophota bacterium]